VRMKTRMMMRKKIVMTIYVGPNERTIHRIITDMCSTLENTEFVSHFFYSFSSMMPNWH